MMSSRGGIQSSSGRQAAFASKTKKRLKGEHRKLYIAVLIFCSSFLTSLLLTSTGNSIQRASFSSQHFAGKLGSDVVGVRVHDYSWVRKT